MTKPQNINEIIGNSAMKDRLQKAITENNGLGGLVIMLQGKTGNGKTLTAEILAGMASDQGGQFIDPTEDCSRHFERILTKIIADNGSYVYIFLCKLPAVCDFG
jgi:Holliday junction resolvasome RuvABC ATP-dependent DNA helicase subunit